MADAEAQAQFRELQKSYVEASGKLKQLASQGRARDTERQRCALTLAELSALPDSVATFKGLGRAFVQQPKPSLEAELREAVSGCEEELVKLKTQKEHLEAKALDVEKSIKELLSGNQALARAVMGA